MLPRCGQCIPEKASQELSRLPGGVIGEVSAQKPRLAWPGRGPFSPGTVSTCGLPDTLLLPTLPPTPTRVTA